MVKTQDNSRFVKLDLDGIVSCTDVILQIVETNEVFTANKRRVFLCEIISRAMYRPAEPWNLRNELIRVNQDRDRLQRKCEKQSKRIEYLEAQETALCNQIQREREEQRT